VRFAFITINRIAEEKAASDEAFRKQLEKTGKPFLWHGRALSDDDLLAKLASLGIVLNRARFLRNIQSFVSAEEMAQAVYDHPDTDIPDKEQDWVWIAFTCLWERWSPDRPSLEMIDDAMQAGYRADAAGDQSEACRHWLQTWRWIRGVMETRGIKTMQEWDDQYSGTQSLYNWVQDFTLSLHNAGLNDRSFIEERRVVLETVLGLPGLEEHLRDNCRRDLAETYFDLGTPEKGEQLFQQWLKEKPRWGWGWIGWADCYYFTHGREKDPARAEQILKQGLAVPGVQDREDMLDRLRDLYEETDRPTEAKAVQEEIERLHKPSPAARVQRTPSILPAVAPGTPRPVMRATAPGRVGRNDPCPCGSGKKYKKCCLRE
jgi:hypothetical protein